MIQSIHGGDVYRNNVLMDFSVNVNPLGIDSKIKCELNKSSELCDRYPDITCACLRKSIADVLGRDADEVICGNGASELFLAVVHALKPKRIVIPVPSFSGYERAAQAAHAQVDFFYMNEHEGFALTEELREHLTEELELLFLANPNNPSGTRIPRELLRRVLDDCRSRNIYVVLDECFLDFMKDAGSAVEMLGDYPNLIVVRAFTKLYAIPGVRLGYLLCADASLREEILLQLPEWNVSLPAQAAGIAACSLSEYRRRTPEYVAREREYLREHLPGMRIFPSAANFLLVQTDVPLYKLLLEEGILVRECSDYRGLGTGFYRIAVRSHEENCRLVEVLENIMEREEKRTETG